MLNKNGKIIAISKDNILSINPDNLVHNSKKPKIEHDRVDVNFKEVDWSSISKTDKWTGLPIEDFTLSHTSNTLTFYFHLLEYLEPSKARYRYKLEGGQDEWSPYNSETKMVLTNLSPGNYKLFIQGNLFSNPNEVSELFVSFSIRPPWWRTWWFISLVVLSGILLASQAFNNRLKRASEQSKVEKRVSELKLEALKAQLNPHFVFNAFSSIQLYILKQDTKNALEYLSKFAKLIRMTLDNSTRSKIRLSEEVEFLGYYLDLEKKRVANLDYYIEISDKIEIESTSIPPMLIQPLIENSIMHGIRHLDGEGMIKISFDTTNENMLRCIIEDNGIGRQKAAEIYANQTRTHSSKSTLINQERIELFNATTKNKSVQMKYTDLCFNGLNGTRVVLVIDSE